MLENGEVDKLVNIENVERETGSYSILSSYNENFIVNGLVSITGSMPANKFSMTDDLIFDENEINELVEAYGLYEYSEWSNYLDEDTFNALNGPFYKILIGKGTIEKKDIFSLLNSFKKDIVK